MPWKLVIFPFAEDADAQRPKQSKGRRPSEIGRCKAPSLYTTKYERSKISVDEIISY